MPVRLGKNVPVRHQPHEIGFDVDGLVVLLDCHLVASAQLALVEHAVLLEGAHHRCFVASA
jgi:hypothetical protein